jgi:hypothetical protein
MSCVLTQNPGFEAGMTGYYPSENTIAYVATNPDVAYAGNNFLYRRLPFHNFLILPTAGQLTNLQRHRG